MNKWCFYCKTDSHSDAECWSTRPRYWVPGESCYMARIAALEQRLVETEQWKQIVIDALVVDCIYSAEHDNDPRKAVHDLCVWETNVALDPRVSSDAQALIDRGRKEGVAKTQSAIDAALESVFRFLQDHGHVTAATIVSERMNSNPLTEMQAKLIKAICPDGMVTDFDELMDIADEQRQLADKLGDVSDQMLKMSYTIERQERQNKELLRYMEKGDAEEIAQQEIIDQQAKEIEGLLTSKEFYERRCFELQSIQKHMRDPERKAVCDVLANGKTYAYAAMRGGEEG